MNNLQLYKIFLILNQIANSNIELPASVGYKILNNLKILQPIFKDIEKRKNEEIEKYKKENNKEILVKEDYLKIEEELKSYENQTDYNEIEIYYFNLEEILNFKLTVKDLQFLLLITIQ